MPGSPPTRIAEAGDQPAAQHPVELVEPACRARRRRLGGGQVGELHHAAPGRPERLRRGPADSGASSTMVFQSPQASQRPDHLEWTAPQAVQV